MHNEYTCNPHVKSAAEFVSRCVEVGHTTSGACVEMMHSHFRWTFETDHLLLNYSSQM